MHNGKFDYEVISHACKIAVKPDWDTIIAARLIDENLYSEKRTSLKYLYVTLIDPKQAKYDIEGLFENVPYAFVDPEIFALYAATDSMKTPRSSSSLKITCSIRCATNPTAYLTQTKSEVCS